jgi:hypothetical protein
MKRPEASSRSGDVDGKEDHLGVNSVLGSEEKVGGDKGGVRPRVGDDFRTTKDRSRRRISKSNPREKAGLEKRRTSLNAP